MAAYYPTLKFIELKNKTEKELMDFIYYPSNLQYSYFVVCMRYRYGWDDEWESSVEICRRHWDNMDYIWFNDWNEGQDIVEYIAVSPIIY